LRVPLKTPNPYYGFFIADTVNQASALASTKDRDAEATNAAVAHRNDRILAVLRNATNEDHGAAPRDWWAWWRGFNEFVQNGPQPVDERTTCYDYNVPYCEPPGRPITLIYHVQYIASCFTKGTPVWTSAGVVPIETIRPGDLVLAQHTETGELAYKPVLETTLRPTAPTVNLDFEGEIITATRGHMFWIVGEGWQMAKELRPGQRLHSVPQSAWLGRTQQSKPADAYNLVVADFNTYFVGQHRLLVHDNTERKAGDGKLPGMAP
jgi:hypothetical protein